MAKKFKKTHKNSLNKKKDFVIVFYTKEIIFIQYADTEKCLEVRGSETGKLT